MCKTKDRELLERLQRGGYPAFRNDDPASNTLSVLVEQTGGPHDSVLMETDAGVLVVLHLKITCLMPEFNRDQMWISLPGYRGLHFQELRRAPKDLYYPNLIVNQRKTIRNGQCIEGVFLAIARAPGLPADLNHGQTVYIHFSVTDHLRDCSTANFPLWIDKLAPKKIHPTKGGILDPEFFANLEKEHAREMKESDWRSPLFDRPVAQSGGSGEVKKSD